MMTVETRLYDDYGYKGDLTITNGTVSLNILLQLFTLITNKY